MTYQPIPEERRRELAAFIPDLAEARRHHPYRDPYTERQFWTRHTLGIRTWSNTFPTSAAERLWLLRHAYLAVAGEDPIEVPGFHWPGFCVRTGRNATEEDWPLEPIPGAKVPPKEPPKATPGPKPDERSVVIEGRVVKPGDTIYVKAPAPGDDPKRTVARAGVNPLGLPRVWFTNDFWRDPTDLTFVAPTKPDERSVVIEGRVVKPGDTIYVKAPAPGDDPKRTVRRVEVNGYDRRVWFTNDRWRHPTDLTFGASALRQAPSFDFGDPTTIIVNPAAAQQSHTMNQATPSKLENTMNQAIHSAASLAFDASSLVETKTFVFGRDIATLDDDTLLNYVQSLTGAIEHLEQLNAKTPLVKLVTKIAQLKDAKAKIVELLGGAPVEQASPAIDADETKPKRVRRTKAEIEADNAAQARAEIKAAPIPLTPPPASKVDPDPSADVDVDIDYNE